MNGKYVEFALIDTYEDYIAKDRVFKAIKLGVDSLSIPPYFLYLAELVPPEINVSSYVDWPFGQETTSVRQHVITSAANRGAKSIDLVCAHSLLLNKKYDKFEADLSACYATAKAKSVRLRLMLDYRLMNNATEVDRICQIAKKIGISRMFPTTGHYVDNFCDNMILSVHITKNFNINTITNGNIYMDEQFDIFLKSKIYGIRINNITALERFSVYSASEDIDLGINQFQDNEE